MQEVQQESRFHLTDSSYNMRRKLELENSVAAGKITGDDAELIRSFISQVIAENHVVPKRSYKLAYVLVSLRKFIGPYGMAGMPDIYECLEMLYSAGYKLNTRVDYTRFLKRFCLWMVENGHNTRLDERKLHKITVGSADTHTVRAEDLFPESEIKAMVDACYNSMDRAWIMTTYEGALRPGEPCDLKWRDVIFNDYNVALDIKFKTEYPRHVPLYRSVPYLSMWYMDYPGQPDPDSYVFVTRTGPHKGEQLQYQGLKDHIVEIARRAGITHKVKLHYFRHSSITQMIRDKVPEPVIKMICWGTTETDQFKIYAHLVSADIERAMALRAGVVTPELRSIVSPLATRQCPRCYTINVQDGDYCRKCGRNLTLPGEVAQQGLGEYMRDRSGDPGEVARAMAAMQAKIDGLTADVQRLSLKAPPAR